MMAAGLRVSATILLTGSPGGETSPPALRDGRLGHGPLFVGAVALALQARAAIGVAALAGALYLYSTGRMVGRNGSVATGDGPRRAGHGVV